MEAVGIIWTDGTVRELVNQARSMDRFSVGVRQFVEALAEVDPGEKTILSLFHSHPSGSVVASRQDRDSILYQWENGMPRPWTILDPGSLSWSMWWVEGREVVGEEWREITHRIPRGM